MWKTNVLWLLIERVCDEPGPNKSTRPKPIGAVSYCPCSQLLRGFIWKAGQDRWTCWLWAPISIFDPYCFPPPARSPLVSPRKLRSNTSTCHPSGWRATAAASNYMCGVNTHTHTHNPSPLSPLRHCTLWQEARAALHIALYRELTWRITEEK